MSPQAKIYVAGHRGMVGSAIVRRLRGGGYANLLLKTRQELDLLDQSAVRAFLLTERPDFVFLAAARVGGILANETFGADFLYENLVIETNVIRGAFEAGVDQLLFLGSSCIYPRDCPQPIKEDYLLTGPLEKTNEPYAIAKIAGVKLCEALNRQYGTRYVSLMPTNLYGPGDSYELQRSHVLPALMRKAYLLALALKGDHRALETDEVRHGRWPQEVRDQLRDILSATDSAAARRLACLTVWGTGAPRREFLHVDDLASACAFFMEKEIRQGLYNVGTGTEVSIRELAKMVLRCAGMELEVTFDHSKSDGTPRKLLDVSKLAALGWRAEIPLQDGIERTYSDMTDGVSLREPI